MKQLSLIALILLSLLTAILPAAAVQYEPPINIVFMVHEEPINPANYQTRLNAVLWMDSLAQTSQYPFKMTYLMGGDMAEYVLLQNDEWVYDQILVHGHEIGTHFHDQYRLGPNNWGAYTCTNRYGVPLYNPDSTERLWSDNKTWVSLLTPNNTTMCSWSFLCSTEGQLMQQFGFTAGPGDRSEKCLDYTGTLMHHPQNPAADDRLGHEIEEDLSANFVHIDHYAQIGNEWAHGYNCLESAMEEHLYVCYQDWLASESANQDSLNNKVWTFGFLTHTWNFDPYYQNQIATFIQHILANYVGHYTPRGNQIARFATVQTVVSEYNAWKASHPGWSSFSHVEPFPTAPLINEALIIPWFPSQEAEWVELYNPTAQWFNLAGYKIHDGLLNNGNYWQFPAQSWLGPHEYAVVSHDGALFRSHYGFRPDFEVSGSTGARQLVSVGSYTLHNQSDGCTLNNTSVVPPNTNTAITDGLSWGMNYAAGFTLPVPGANQTYGRDANSTDTGDSLDWHLNGGAIAATPGGANANAYFAPQVFVQADPISIPTTVPSSGGPVVFNVKAGNELPTVQVVDFWTSVVLPSGNVNSPLLLRTNRNLAASDSMTLQLTQWVPASAPAGIYRYDVHVGDYPNAATDLSYFYFQKLGHSEGDAEVWPAPEITSGDLGQANVAGLVELLPAKLELKASPNPFNRATTLQLSLPEPGGDANLRIYDLAGRVVWNIYLENLSPGRHDLSFDGRELASGVYLAILNTPSKRVESKLVLLK